MLKLKFPFDRDEKECPPRKDDKCDDKDRPGKDYDKDHGWKGKDKDGDGYDKKHPGKDCDKEHGWKGKDKGEKHEKDEKEHGGKDRDYDKDHGWKGKDKDDKGEREHAGKKDKYEKCDDKEPVCKEDGKDYGCKDPCDGDDVSDLHGVLASMSDVCAIIDCAISQLPEAPLDGGQFVETPLEMLDA